MVLDKLGACFGCNHVVHCAKKEMEFAIKWLNSRLAKNENVSWYPNSVQTHILEQESSKRHLKLHYGLPCFMYSRSGFVYQFKSTEGLVLTQAYRM